MGRDPGGESDGIDIGLVLRDGVAGGGGVSARGGGGSSSKSKMLDNGGMAGAGATSGAIPGGGTPLLY